MHLKGERTVGPLPTTISEENDRYAEVIAAADAVGECHDTQLDQVAARWVGPGCTDLLACWVIRLVHARTLQHLHW